MDKLVAKHKLKAEAKEAEQTVLEENTAIDAEVI